MGDMTNGLTVTERIRQLWKDTAMSAAERANDNTGYHAVQAADFVTESFINRFYPDDEDAQNIKKVITND